MDTTKIYVIEESAGYMFSSRPIAFLLSREDAEYKVFCLNKETNRNGIIFSAYYSYTEIPAMTIEKGKDYKEFVDMKIKEKNKELKNSRDCIEKDEENIKKLTQELNYYSSLNIKK